MPELICKLLHIGKTTYYKYLREGYPIITFLLSFKKSELEELLESGTISKYDQFNLYSKTISVQYIEFASKNLTSFSALADYFHLLQWLLDQYSMNKEEHYFWLTDGEAIVEYAKQGKIDNYELIVNLIKMDRTLLIFIISSYKSGFDIFYNYIEQTHREDDYPFDDVFVLQHKIYHSAALKGIVLDNLEYYISNTLNSIEFDIDSWHEHIGLDKRNAALKQILKDIEDDKIDNGLLKKALDDEDDILVKLFAKTLKNPKIYYSVEHLSEKFIISLENINYTLLPNSMTFDTIKKVEKDPRKAFDEYFDLIKA